MPGKIYLFRSESQFLTSPTVSAPAQRYSIGAKLDALTAGGQCTVSVDGVANNGSLTNLAVFTLNDTAEVIAPNVGVSDVAIRATVTAISGSLTFSTWIQEIK